MLGAGRWGAAPGRVSPFCRFRVFVFSVVLGCPLDVRLSRLAGVRGRATGQSWQLLLRPGSARKRQGLGTECRATPCYSSAQLSPASLYARQLLSPPLYHPSSRPQSERTRVLTSSSVQVPPVRRLRERSAASGALVLPRAARVHSRVHGERDGRAEARRGGVPVRGGEQLRAWGGRAQQRARDPAVRRRARRGRALHRGDAAGGRGRGGGAGTYMFRSVGLSMCAADRATAFFVLRSSFMLPPSPGCGSRNRLS